MILAWEQDPAPETSTQRNYGREFILDLNLCRAALLERGAALRSNQRRRPIIALVAAEAGVDVKTVRAFFRGERQRAETWTSIVTQGLGLPLQRVLLSGQENARGDAPDKRAAGVGSLVEELPNEE